VRRGGEPLPRSGTVWSQDNVKDHPRDKDQVGGFAVDGTRQGTGPDTCNDKGLSVDTPFVPSTKIRQERFLFLGGSFNRGGVLKEYLKKGGRKKISPLYWLLGGSEGVTWALR